MIKTPCKRAGLLAAAAFLAAQPALAQELIVTRPAEAPAGAAVRPSVPPTAPSPSASTPVTGASELPAGAPTDDYEFLGWCTGILTGHMELYPKVKPELDAISKRWNTVASDAKSQAQQQAAGKELLGEFRHAMGTMEAASPTPISFKGQIAIQKGLSTWSGVEKLEKQNQAYSWMNFGLPGRCENKAAEVEKTLGKKVAANGALKPPVKSEAPDAKNVGLRK